MSQSILYNKSLNSDIPILEIKVYKKKLRIYLGISLTLLLVLIVICILLVLLWLGLINKKPIESVKRIVGIKCGSIEGNINNGIIEFLGIPYAYPPIERRRFTHAQEILDEKGCKEVYGNLNGPYLAKSYKSQCVQYEKTTNNLVGNENCLFLNIYTPSTNIEKKLPVIFVISGLFFSYGSGNMQGLTVTPEIVKNTQSIHVTSNYRLGPMNSIINPETNETNHGLSDQLLALTWIRKNIAVFGGDPSNIVLYGVGSGSTVALALSNSDKAIHLFSKIWISNPVTFLTKTLESALNVQKKYLSDEKKLEIFQGTLKLKDIFKNWTWNNIENIIDNRWFNFPIPDDNKFNNDIINFLIIDNDIIIDGNILKKIRRNSNIPMVIGNSANEVDIFPSPNSVRFWQLDYFRDFIKLKMKPFGKTVNETFLEIFNKNYASGPILTAEEGYTRAVTDIRITCPLNSLLKKLMGFSNHQPIYRYILEDKHKALDYFEMKYSNELAAYGWDNILYFHGYKTHLDYGKYGEKEIGMSAVLNKAMHDFAWNDELKDMALSKDGYIMMNLITKGKIIKECHLKNNECKFWADQLGNIENYLWTI